MAVFKTHPEHPSSNWDSGIRKNFSNQFFKIVVLLVFVYSGLFVYGLVGWWFLIVWYIPWFLFFVMSIIPILKYQQYLQDSISSPIYWVDGDEFEGCLVNVFILALLSPLVLPFWFIFNSSIRTLRNRFVWWKGGVYFFRKEKELPMQIESYNPFFLLCMVLFRRADQYDVHALEIEKARSKEMANHQAVKALPSPRKDLLDDFAQQVDSFLELEIKDDADTWFHEEEHFLDYLEEYVEGELDDGMRLYVRRRHKQKMKELKKR